MSESILGAAARSTRPGKGFLHHGSRLLFLDVLGARPHFSRKFTRTRPPPGSLSRRRGLYFPVKSLWGAGEEAHFTISVKKGGGAGGLAGDGWGRGQKGAKLHPSRPPPCPKRRFRRRRREAARKLCPFKGTSAARRGGKDAGSGLCAAGTAEQRRALQSHSHYLQRSHSSSTPAPPPRSPPPKESSNPEHVPCPLSGEEVGRKRNESFL